MVLDLLSLRNPDTFEPTHPLICYLSKQHPLNSMNNTSQTNIETPAMTRSLKDLVNTPFKKAMLVVQILSYFLIVGSPFIGAAIGKMLDLNTVKTGGVILGVFIAGEILFYGSLAFLGKEVVLIIRDKLKSVFKKRKKGLS